MLKEGSIIEYELIASLLTFYVICNMGIPG
jgi:hypothetical protein